MEFYPINGEGTLVSFNRQGEIINTDKNFTSVFGISPEEIVGKKLQDVILTPPYQCSFLGMLDSYINRGNSHGRYYLAECAHKNGLIFPVTMYTSEISEEGQNPILILQISKLKNPVCSITFDNNGSIIAATFADVMEYSTAEIITLQLTSIFPLLLPQQLEGESKTSYKYLKDLLREEYRMVQGFTKNGALITFKMAIDTVCVGEFIIFRASLEKEDLEHMESMFIIDEKGTILDCNGFVQPLFGYSRNELLGTKLTTLGLDVSTNRDGSSSKRQKTSLSEWSPTSSFYFTQMKHKNGEIISINWKGLDIHSTDKQLIRIKRVFLPPLQISHVKTTKQKRIGNYIIGDTIGTGAFGKVKRGVHITTRKEVAVKILNKLLMEPTDLERSKREGSILQQLNHPNIVKFLGSEENEKNLYFFLELIGGTDLKVHMLQNKLSPNEVRNVFKQIAEAIYFCHDLSIIHRDLKQSNILVDDTNCIKLIDFGLSNYTEEGKLRSTFCGSPAYAAPEMLLGTKYLGPEVDVWSLGVVLYTMATSKLPFESVGQLLKGTYDIPENMDEDLVHLLKSMLNSVPENRISVKDVLNHPWISKLL